MKPFGFSKMVVEDDIFHALADPTRRIILDELAQRDEQTLYELCARLIMRHQVGMTRQAIGKHVAILEQAGLVRATQRGKYKVLSLDDSPIQTIGERWLKSLRKSD